MTDESKSPGRGVQANLSATQSAEPGADVLRQTQRDASALKCARWVVGLHLLALLVAGQCMRLCGYYLVYPLKLKVDLLGIQFPAQILNEIELVSVIDNFWYMLILVAIPILVINYRTALSIGRMLGPWWAECYGTALTCLIAARAVYTFVVFQFPVIM